MALPEWWFRREFAVSFPSNSDRVAKEIYRDAS
jgi:hypothetical protein